MKGFVSFLQDRTNFWLVVSAGMVLLLINNNSLALWDQDEAAYAGFARRMIETGNYLVPDFLWSEPHRKTPLHFWLITLSYRLFGESDFALRLPSVLAVLGTVALTAFYGKNIFGKERSLLAAFILLSSLLLPALGKIAVTDGILIFFETLSFFALLNYLQSGKWLHWVLLLLGAASAALVKGPPVYILCGFALALLFWYPKYRWRSVFAGVGLLLSLFPLFNWGYLATQAGNDAFISWLIDWYILKRAGGSVWGQTGPPGYFLAIFGISFLVFLPYFPRAIKEFCLRLRNWKQVSETDLFLLSWCLGGWLFYELMMSKLPAYAGGAFPAVALILAGSILENYSVPRLKWASIVQLTVYWILGAGLMVLGYFHQHWYLTLLNILAGLVVSGLAYVFYKRGRKEYETLPHNLIVTIAFLPPVLIWGIGIPAVDNMRGFTRDMALQASINRASSGEGVILGSHLGLPSLPVYLERNKVPYQYNENSFQLKRYLEGSRDTLTIPKAVILLSDDGWKHLQEEYQKSNDSLPSVTEVFGFVSDRGRGSAFYWVRPRKDTINSRDNQP